MVEEWEAIQNEYFFRSFQATRYSGCCLELREGRTGYRRLGMFHDLPVIATLARKKPEEITLVAEIGTLGVFATALR